MAFACSVSHGRHMSSVTWQSYLNKAGKNLKTEGGGVWKQPRDSAQEPFSQSHGAGAASTCDSGVHYHTALPVRPREGVRLPGSRGTRPGAGLGYRGLPALQLSSAGAPLESRGSLACETSQITDSPMPSPRGLCTCNGGPNHLLKKEAATPPPRAQASTPGFHQPPLSAWGTRPEWALCWLPWTCRQAQQLVSLDCDHCTIMSSCKRQS